MKKNFYLIIIIALGALLRFYHNTAISLWHDEAFSALMIRYPWHEMFTRLAIDVHPPMYYIFLRFWHYVFGDSLLSLRGFSIFFSVLCIPATWLFVITAFKNEKIALWAAFLSSVNLFQLLFVTEARMYTMGAFFAIMAAYFLVKALREQKQYFENAKLHLLNMPNDIVLLKNYKWNYVGFIVSSAIIILTHYYLLFTAAALGLYGLAFCISYYRKNFKQYGWFLGSWVLIGICFLPWLKVFLSQLHSVSQSYWIPDLTWWSIPSTLWSILLGFANDTSDSLTRKLLLIVTAFTIYFLYTFVKKTDFFEKWLVVLAVVLPFVGSVLFYLKSLHCIHVGSTLQCSGRSVYQDRYFLYAAIFYTMALAVWFSTIKTKYIGTVLLIVYCLINGAAIYHYWSGINIYARPGMAAAAKYIGYNSAQGDKVYIGTSFEFFNYKYYALTYYRLHTAPLLYTGGRASDSQISAIEGSALLADADLLPNFKQGVTHGDIVWLIWTNAFGANKPTDVPIAWTQIDEKVYPDVRPYVGTNIYVDEYKVN